jgi:protein phosphatase
MAVTESSRQLRYAIAARTDTGRQRAANEDAVAVVDAADLAASAAFVVADGMGGMKSGDVASREAVRVVRETLVARLGGRDAATGAGDDVGASDPQAALAQALRDANRAVYALARTGNGAETRGAALGDDGASPENEPGPAPERAHLMGTTCVAGVVRREILYLAHVGDSRAYLLRGGRLARLTRDHSFVEEQVRAGELTPEEARNSRFRNMITRAVGIEPEVEPDLRAEPLQAGDLLLVCTDGLTTMLDDAEIERLLTRGAAAGPADLERTAAVLVDAANRRGGADNITVLLLRASSENGAAGADGPAADASPVPPGRREPPRPAPAVVDLDEVPSRPGRGRGVAPGGRRRGGGASALVALLALVGALSLALVTALAFSGGLRQRVLLLLSGSDASRPAENFGGRASAAESTDFARLRYGPPTLFTRYLARGDILTYSPRGYLFFVAQTSGKIACVSRTGDVLRSLGTLPLAPPPPNPTPASRVFVTSDAQGNVYTSRTAGRIIEKRNAEGSLLLTLKGFERPEAVTVDEDGNLYVVDFNQVKILRALPSGGGGRGDAGARSAAPRTLAAPPTGTGSGL